MRVIGKEKKITKLEMFIEIKKELNYQKDLDKYLFKKINSSTSDGSKGYFEDILLKFNVDKMLLKQIQKYMQCTCKHLITDEICNSSYKESIEKLNDVSKKVVLFFSEVKVFHIDNKEKIQIVDLDCQEFVDFYVILNYLDKKCDDEKIENILQLTHRILRKSGAK